MKEKKQSKKIQAKRIFILYFAFAFAFAFETQTIVVFATFYESKFYHDQQVSLC